MLRTFHCRYAIDGTRILYPGIKYLTTNIIYNELSTLTDNNKGVKLFLKLIYKILHGMFVWTELNTKISYTYKHKTLFYIQCGSLFKTFTF